MVRRAGVTKPTAYSHFPDPDALIAGLLAHVRERLGITHGILAEIPPSKLASAVRDNYRRFEESSLLLRRLMSSPRYDRVRLSQNVDRAGIALRAWSAVGLSEADLRERLGAVYLLTSPPSWLWLRDTWGLSPEGASRAAAGAMETLVEKLRGKGSRVEEKEHANSSRHDSGKRPRARRTRPR